MSVLETRYENIRDWLYGGDRDTEVTNEYWRSTRIRFSQTCCSAYHGGETKEYPPGTVMILERAVVDGKWCSCYTCEDCISKSERELSAH